MNSGLQFIVRHVQDVAAARAFYTGKLGFEVADEGPGFVQFAAPNGAALLLSQETGSPDDLPIELWWVVDDADATAADLAARGIEIAVPLKDEPFGRTFAIKDATGGLCHLLQPPRQ